MPVTVSQQCSFEKVLQNSTRTAMLETLEKFEYDKQNGLQHNKTQVRSLVVNHGKVRKSI